MFLWIPVGSCRIRRIVKRSPEYSGNANPRVRVSVTVQSCDRERFVRFGPNLQDVYPRPRKTYRNSREARVLRPSIRSRRDPLRVKLWDYL
ncbi:unnamed protein product [Prunus armeniaca]